MINALQLNKFAAPNKERIHRYYQFLFRRMFRKLLCDSALLRAMKNYPLFETYHYNLYENVFLEGKKQIHDYRIERYQVYVQDKKKDIIVKCILIIKTDGTIWVDAVVTRNRYSASNIRYRAESTSSKEIYNNLVKTLLTWN